MKVLVTIILTSKLRINSNTKTKEIMMICLLINQIYKGVLNMLGITEILMNMRNKIITFLLSNNKNKRKKMNN